MRIAVRIANGIILLAGIALSATVAAQDKTVNDGVFTAAQVTSGQVVYDSQCKTCHNKRI